MKFFAGLNAWMLPAAAIASFLFGGAWYTMLAKPWMAAARWSFTAASAATCLPPKKCWTSCGR